MHRARYIGKGSEILYSPTAHHSFQIWMCSPTWKLSEPCPFALLWKVHCSTIDWIIGCWFLIQPPAPFTLPGGQGDGTESSNSLIIWFVLLGASPPSLVLAKSHFINIARDTLFLYHLGNSKSFKSSVLEKGTKTKYIYISYYKSQHQNLKNENSDTICNIYRRWGPKRGSQILKQRYIR